MDEGSSGDSFHGDQARAGRSRHAYVREYTPQLENQSGSRTGGRSGSTSDQHPGRSEYSYTTGRYQGHGYHVSEEKAGNNDKCSHLTRQYYGQRHHVSEPGVGNDDKYSHVTRQYPRSHVSDSRMTNNDTAENFIKPHWNHFDIGRNSRRSGYRSRPSEVQPSAPSEHELLPGATTEDCSPGVGLHTANPGEDLSDTFAAEVNMDTRASEMTRSQNPPVSDTRPIYQGPPPRYDEKFPERAGNSPIDDGDLRVLLNRVTMETAPGDALVALVTLTYQKTSIGENILEVDTNKLIDTILHLIKDRRNVHNTLAVLCNVLYTSGDLRTIARTNTHLSYRLMMVLKQEAGEATAGVCARAIMNLTYVGTNNVEWFGRREKKKKSKGKAKLQGVSPDHVAECLCNSSAVDVYAQCLTESSDPEVIEPVLGIIQNLAAGTSQEARQLQACVRKAKMLPMLVDLLAEQENVKRGALAAMLNLCFDDHNKELLAKYAMKPIVKVLSLDGADCPSTSTTCVTLALLWELFYDPRLSRMGLYASLNTRVHDSKEPDDSVCVIRLVSNLAASTEQPISVRQYASEVLQRLWSHKDLQSICKEKGLTKDKLYSNLTKHGLDMEQLARDVPVYRLSDPQPSCPQQPSPAAPSKRDAMNDYHDNLSRDEMYEPPPPMTMPYDTCSYHDNMTHGEMYEPPPAYEDVV